MERKEQTGHICRWMALGIMTAIVIVGCTIVIGLFEWRDRKEIESRNAELHQWRKNVHDLNLHITELSLLGEMVADWDSTDVNEYHSLRLEVDSMLEGIAGICPKENSDTICRLLAEKEQLLLDIKDAMQELNATQEKLTAEVPRIVEQNKTRTMWMYPFLTWLPSATEQRTAVTNRSSKKCLRMKTVKELPTSSWKS